MEADGFRVIRILNSEVMTNLGGVMEGLLLELNEKSRSLSHPTLDPSPQGERDDEDWHPRLAAKPVPKPHTGRRR
jgi:hypothetical protein